MYIERHALYWNPQVTSKRDRPRKTWKRTLERELQKVGIIQEEAKGLALDRTRWKRFTKALCSTWEQREKKNKTVCNTFMSYILMT